MDDAWKTLKRIIFILLLFYFMVFLLETDFLLKIGQIKPETNFSRYLFKILNIQ